VDAARGVLRAEALTVRRLAAVALVVAVGAAALVSAGAGGSGGGYRVDAIFDNASQLIPGQDVKIAGARVGSVRDVVLTPDRRARIVMDVDPRFAPFRSDADCTIQPQSIIGEKFVQCSPGTPRGWPLRGDGDAAPTVPARARTRRSTSTSSSARSSSPTGSGSG